MLYTLIFSIIGLAIGGLGGAFGGFLIGSIFDSIRNPQFVGGFKQQHSTIHLVRYRRTINGCIPSKDHLLVVRFII